MALRGNYPSAEKNRKLMNEILDIQRKNDLYIWNFSNILTTKEIG